MANEDKIDRAKIDRAGAATADETFRVLRDRFEVLELLGQGSQGRTYRGRDRQSGTPVAIKELSIGQLEDWKAIELFEREGLVLQHLHHRGIPRYIDAFHITDIDRGERFFLVQEFIDGQSLKSLIQNGLTVTEAQALRFLRRLLEILMYLQDRSPPVVHRDIKPANIMRREDGEFALIDFGAVQSVIPEGHGGSTVIGTSGYMPIEQLYGRATPATDLYALGATAVHLLSGRHPSTLPMAKMRLGFEPFVNTSVPLQRFLASLLEPMVERRIATAWQALRVLDDLARGHHPRGEMPSAGADTIAPTQPDRARADRTHRTDRTGSAVHQGMLMISDAAQLAAARRYRKITGGLFIQLGAGANRSVELPNLICLGGPLTITDQCGLRSLSLPSLEQLGGTLSILQVENNFELYTPNLDTIEEGLSITGTGLSSLNLEGIRLIRGMVMVANNDRLHSLTLPHLELVGGLFCVSHNRRLRILDARRLRYLDGQLTLTNLGLTTLALDDLQTIGAGLGLTDLDHLQRLSLASLTTVGMTTTHTNRQLALNNLPYLVDLQLPELSQLGDDLIIVNSPQITRLDLAQLQTVGGHLNLTNNQALQRINLATLTDLGGDFMINNNPALEALTLERLQSAEEVRILNNGRLPSSTVQTIIDHLQAQGWLGHSWTVNNG